MDDQSTRILKIEKYPFTASLVESACEGVKACFVIRSGISFPMRCHSVACGAVSQAQSATQLTARSFAAAHMTL